MIKVEVIKSKYQKKYEEKKRIQLIKLVITNNRFIRIMCLTILKI